MTETEAAYIAGIVDGEGCLSVRKQGRSFGVSIIVVQKDPVIPHWLVPRCGGHVDLVTRKSWGAVRTYFRWTLGGKDKIVPLLTGILPYLIMKRERARLCLELVQTMLDGGKGWTANGNVIRGKPGRPLSLPDEIVRLRASLVEQLHHLSSPNLAGGHPLSQEGFPR
jgi:hypothetical protein